MATLSAGRKRERGDPSDCLESSECSCCDDYRWVEDACGYTSSSAVLLEACGLQLSPEEVAELRQLLHEDFEPEDNEEESSTVDERGSPHSEPEVRRRKSCKTDFASPFPSPGPRRSPSSKQRTPNLENRHLQATAWQTAPLKAISLELGAQAISRVTPVHVLLKPEKPTLKHLLIEPKA